MTEKLYDYICPVCHYKYGVCPHTVAEMLDAQAAEIERLTTALDKIIAGQYYRVVTEPGTWVNTRPLHELMQETARAAREKREEG